MVVFTEQIASKYQVRSAGRLECHPEQAMGSQQRLVIYTRSQTNCHRLSDKIVLPVAAAAISASSVTRTNG